MSHLNGTNKDLTQRYPFVLHCLISFWITYISWVVVELYHITINSIQHFYILFHLILWGPLWSRTCYFSRNGKKRWIKSKEAKCNQQGPPVASPKGRTENLTLSTLILSNTHYALPLMKWKVSWEPCLFKWRPQTGCQTMTDGQVVKGCLVA